MHCHDSWVSYSASFIRKLQKKYNSLFLYIFFIVKKYSRKYHLNLQKYIWRRHMQLSSLRSWKGEHGLLFVLLLQLLGDGTNLHLKIIWMWGTFVFLNWSRRSRALPSRFPSFEVQKNQVAPFHKVSIVPFLSTQWGFRISSRWCS